jgi:cyanophycin synthetase
MQILDVLELNGPNIWANFAVVEALVDLGAFEEKPSNLLPGFTERLTRWLPELIEHRCSIGERGGFIQRLENGTWLGHVLEHVSLELHSRSHLPVGYGRARETGEYGVYRVVVECADPHLGRACLESARSLVLAAVEDGSFDVDAEVRRLADVANNTCLGPGTRAIVAAARARGIPTIRLTDGNLIQLGYGKAQRRIWTAETDRTSAVAEGIAQDKQLTRKLLQSVGVPVPAGREATSPDDAWAAAEELGLPVVVKPGDGNHGRGVSIRLSERSVIETAYAYAAREGSSVVVERFVPGTQYRVLVVGERAVAASGGQAEQVVGDGERTVRDLVDAANQDIQRGDDSTRLLSMITLDDISLELLRRQGLDAGSVPNAGRSVLLHHNGDLTVDVTDRMHPEIAARCALAAKTVGLDIAGIDLIAEDIGQPLESQGGALIEVNASPALVMHLAPLTGKSRPVGEAIVDLLFSAELTEPVPVIAVSGTSGRGEVATALARMFENTGKVVALAGSSGLRAEGRLIQEADASNATSARRALMNPYLDAAVLEVSETSVLSEGLGFARCDVAVVTRVEDGEPVGGRFRWGPESVRKAVRAPVDIVPKGGAAVLYADDAEVLKMAEHCKGEVIFFGSPDAPPLREHLERGGRAVVTEGGVLVVCRGIRRERISLTGMPDGMSEIACAAVAAVGLFLGISTTKAN